MNKTHAVYAICTDSAGEKVTLRIGLPTDWDRAIARWYRLDNRRIGTNVPQRRVRVRFFRRWYTVSALEVRSTDRHGRGIGQERHRTALPVPYRLVRSALNA